MPMQQRGPDGGVLVDNHMRASDPAGVVFAAGDCCCMEWPKDESPHWFQMRLWSQARLSALFAAKCMAGFEDELGAGGSFLLFSHATRFFGYQVIRIL
ncbi:unnamed protein product [Discosporangium mesarthrocarpum]